MNSIPTIVLPGLDGTDLLLGRFAELAPSTHSVQICPLPDNPTDDYPKLCDKLAEQICGLQSCHLIAESFSGPLGILLAHRFPAIVDRLTLVATFAVSPTPLFARMIPWSIIFRLPMPTFIAQRYFVGSDTLAAKQLKKAVRVTSPQTLVKRMQCLMNVDVTTQLTELNCMIEYIRPTHDRLVPKRSLTTIVDANPNLSICNIDGPHLVLQTRPEHAWKCLIG